MGESRHVRPTKTQISRRIRAVWSEPSLSAWWNVASLAMENAPSEDFEQMVRMRRLIWIYGGCTCPKVYCMMLASHIYNYSLAMNIYLLWIFICDKWFMNTIEICPFKILVYVGIYRHCSQKQKHLSLKVRYCTFGNVRPARTQISLRSLIWVFARRFVVAKDSRFLQMVSKHLD